MARIQLDASVYHSPGDALAPRIPRVSLAERQSFDVIRTHTDEYPMTMLSTCQAAAELGLSKSFLDKKRGKGGGPRYLKLGRRVLYDPRDLRDWLDERRRRNTSEDRAEK